MFESEGKQVQHHFFLLLLCLICTINCSQITEYKYTFYLDDSNVHDLSKNMGIKLYNQNLTGQVLDEFIIKQPKQIDNVVQIITKVNPQSSANDSIPTEIDPNELLSAPEIDKIWIDSYTWPIKKNSLYYLLGTQKQIAEKQQRIVSATYVPLTTQKSVQKILNDDLQIYVLLSTGEIKLLSKNHEQLTTQKTYSYNNPQQNKQQPQWQEGQLFHTNGGLTLFMSQSFYFISLNEISNSRQARTFYDLYKLISISTVLKVVQTHHQLLLFTDKQCFKLINNNDPQLVISYSQLLTQSQSFIHNSQQQQQSFIDFTAFGNNVYFLHQELGVIVYEIKKQQVKLLTIEHPQLAVGINVQNQIIMITYNVADQEYLQEYQFNEEKGMFVVNKIYTYHSQQAVGDILLFEKQMIISRGSQILHGFHSLSRKLPYAFHKQSQVLESKSLNNQVIQLRSIWSQGFRLPGYMIITEKSIELIEFQPHQGKDIQQKQVSISSKTSGTMTFDIQFIGTCKNSSFYPPDYCSLTKTIKLTFNDRVNEQITLWWLWLLIAIGCYLILVALFAIFYTYFSKKQNQFESLIENQRQRKRSSNVIEMSFDTGTLPTEQDQK